MRVVTLMMATVMGSSGVMAIAQQAPPAASQAATPEAVTPDVSEKKVVVLAFEQIGGTAGNYDWVGRAVQQNLVTELGRAKPLELITASQAGTQPATDVKAAVEAGKSLGADAVVFGSYQLLEPDLRINGMVVDVATGEVLGTLKSTGTVRDLFAMEDTVATQARRYLVPPVSLPGGQPPAVPVPVVQQQQQPVVMNPLQQPTNSFVNDYNRYTYYPNTAYGYYGYYGYGWGGGWGWGGCWSRPAWGCGFGSNYPYVENTGAMIGRATRPVGVGTSQGMVAKALITVPRGMITVPGNYYQNSQVARK